MSTQEPDEALPLPHLHFERRGTGSPVLLVPGLGSTWRTFDLVLADLVAAREVIALDLPGFGASPPFPSAPTFSSYADAVAGFISEHDLAGIDLVGSSVGARLVLELARRGVGRNVVALDPGGFWSPQQLRVFAGSIKSSIRLLRTLRPVLPTLAGNAVGRSALLTQLSARPWALPADLVRRELCGWADAPGYDALLNALIADPEQPGMPVEEMPGRVVIGWGRRDLVVTPSQAATALSRFPGAALHWFDVCGHFPMWDKPEETVRVILDATR